MSDEGFFKRWSKRKSEAQAAATPALPATAAEAVQPGPPPDATLAAAEPDVPAPTLEDVAALDAKAPDFSRFVAPGVDADVKRAALRKLFSDPQFNVMDGLDTYIGDYNTPDPLPASMLRQMAQAKFLGLFEDDQDAPHEDAHLQLQPDDADRRAGAGAGAEGEPGQPDAA